MKEIKDKDFYKVSKEETQKTKGVKNILGVMKLANINKKLLFVVCLVFGINLAISIAGAYITKAMLGVFTGGDYHVLITIAFVTFGLSVISRIGNFFSQYCFDKLSKELSKSIKYKIHERISNLKASCFISTKTSTFTSRLNETNTVIRVFEIILSMISRFVTSSAYIITLLVSTPLLWIVCTAFFLVEIIVMNYLFPKRRALERRNRKLGEKVANTNLEAIRGANDLKGLNMSNRLNEKYIEQLDELQSAQFSVSCWWRKRVNTVTFFTGSLNTLVITLLIAYCGIYGLASPENLLFFWTHKNYIFTFFNCIFDIRNSLSDVELSASRIMELFDETMYPLESFGNVEIADLKGNITFNNVNFAYEADKQILNGIDCTMEANRITAIVGKTGCGKSTILSLINRFYDADSGEILIDGVDVKDLTKNSLRKNIAYIQQSPYIFNMTFKDNLLLANPDATDEEIELACKKSEIHDFIMTTKNGYDTMLGENGINLSGGQKQRLAIARAFLNNAKIIIFDESTSSLDNENQAKIQATIENLRNDHTIIVVAHRLSTIINADKIIYMEDSQIKATGTHKQLFKNCKAYKKLYQIESV